MIATIRFDEQHETLRDAMTILRWGNGITEDVLTKMAMDAGWIAANVISPNLHVLCKMGENRA